ncbi:hypothetical protein CBR_g16948 [Chara braunii]|uniref:Uncharacterized protein n=1 Tax=Chara braunii TaxID=69332 RepID=A0A388KU63_CHABU|nr:hypothetical protein CBR_g16948 [Chara braunii]|eukprot:GBG73605.1 hypothetical protein CBR_g16948 [Chara braunii]
MRDRKDRFFFLALLSALRKCSAVDVQFTVAVIIFLWISLAVARAEINGSDLLMLLPPQGLMMPAESPAETDPPFATDLPATNRTLSQIDLAPSYTFQVAEAPVPTPSLISSPVLGREMARHSGPRWQKPEPPRPSAQQVTEDAAYKPALLFNSSKYKTKKGGFHHANEDDDEDNPTGYAGPGSPPRPPLPLPSPPLLPGPPPPEEEGGGETGDDGSDMWKQPPPAGEGTGGESDYGGGSDGTPGSGGDDGNVVLPHTCPIDWNNVPAKVDATGKNKVHLTGLQACECDLTAIGCDPNCCCDTQDCRKTETALFTGCLPEGRPPPALHYCLPRSSVAKVNLKHSGGLAVVRSVSPSGGLISNQFCIARDNNPELGHFFLDPPPADSEAMEYAIASSPVYSSFWRAPARTVKSSTTIELRVNDSIPAAHMAESTRGGARLMPANNWGVWALPSSLASGYCSPVHPVGFLNDVETSCTIATTAANLPFACTKFLDGSHFVRTLWIGRNGQAWPPNQDRFVPVQLIRVLQLHPATGDLITVNVGSFANSFPSSVYEAGSSTCRNSLAEAAYRVIHDGAGSVVGVDATLTVTEVQANIYGLVVAPQRFSVKFYRQGTVDLVRPRSGNPGYRHGLPVLAGVRTDNAQTKKVAVACFVDGLPIPKGNPVTGLCSPSQRTHVKFGGNAMVSCSISMTRAQLRDFCSGAIGSAIPSRPAISIQLLTGLLSSTGPRILVGRWGSSDPNNVDEWLDLVVVPTQDVMKWSEEMSTCSQLVSGLRF